MYTRKRLVGESRGGRELSSLVSYLHWRNPVWGACVQTKRPETLASPITSRATFSTHPSADFHTPEEFVDLWHLPDVGKVLDGSLQSKAIALDVRRLVGPTAEGALLWL